MDADSNTPRTEGSSVPDKSRRGRLTDDEKVRIVEESYRDGETVAQVEVVLQFRPECSPVKVDQGFTSGCHFQGFRFVGMDFARGQYAMGGVVNQTGFTGEHKAWKVRRLLTG